MTLWNENAASFAMTGERRAGYEFNVSRKAWLERVRARDVDAAMAIAWASLERQVLFLGIGRIPIPFGATR